MFTNIIIKWFPILMVSFLLINIIISIYIVKEANRRKVNAPYIWGFINIIFPIIGLVLFLLLTKKIR